MTGAHVTEDNRFEKAFLVLSPAGDGSTLKMVPIKLLKMKVGRLINEGPTGSGSK